MNLFLMLEQLQYQVLMKASEENHIIIPFFMK